MKRWIKYIVIFALLAGGVILCAIRWQAWFGMPNEPQWTGDTLHYTFPFFDRDTTPEELEILVLGDIHNRLKREDYDTLAARLPYIDGIAQSGDWMDRGQDYYYQLLLREWTHSALYGTPVIVAPGNHEYSKGLHRTLSPVWENAFAHPHNGPKGVPGAHYYVDFDQVRFIVIDTNPLDRLVYLTRTLTWLRQAMYTASGRFIVVIMHHPVLSVAKGRFNSLIYATFRHALGEADLVIAGHDHSYMRKGCFVVSNISGNPKQQHFRYTPDVTATEPVYGVLRVSNLKSQMQFTVYRLEDGALIDSLYVKHD